MSALVSNPNHRRRHRIPYHVPLVGGMATFDIVGTLAIAIAYVLYRHSEPGGVFNSTTEKHSEYHWASKGFVLWRDILFIFTLLFAVGTVVHLAIGQNTAFIASLAD